MKNLIITQPDFVKFLESAMKGSWEVFAPVKTQNSLRFEKLSDTSQLENITLDGVRTDQPVKSFFFYTKEKVASLPAQPEKPAEPARRIILGVKGCDLHALKVFDKAYYEEGVVPEPLYQERRKSTYVIGSDCGYSIDSCFCTLLGSKPYPVSGFDLNVSVSGSDLLVETGSEKGEELVGEMKKTGAAVSEASAQQVEERDRKREALTTQLQEANKEFELPKTLDELCNLAFDSGVWKELADSKCVQCNGCLHACPTCYCFLMYDKNKGGVSERTRVWDACINAGYARVAGGANPRPNLQARLRHRFFHKFLYFQQLFGMFACSGCGRCFKVCPGKIEIRGTFKQISSKLKAQS